MAQKTMVGLREILRRNKLTQARVAVLLKQPPDVISRWVTGDRVPDTANVIRILAFLRQYEPTLSFEDLFAKAKS